jgi:ATPase subunit of ABC transporter with duplicated ATPase domains
MVFTGIPLRGTLLFLIERQGFTYLLTISDLSFSYDSHPVFNGLSLSFGDGWTALTGANGSGKSTLVNLICGVLTPDAGRITAGGAVAVCPQEQEAPPACFADPEIVNDGEFFSLLSKLCIGDDWAGRWDTLSGGEKKRCVIADMLIRKPDILILDEPANHIDEPAMRLLSDALSPFAGTGIIVSHNMAFLDRLASSTVMLVRRQEGSCAFHFSTPPLNAAAEFEKEQGGLRERKRQLAAETKRLETAKKDAVREALQDKARRMSKRHLAPHDSDTRNKINLARLSGRDKTGGKKVAMFETAQAKKESALQTIDARPLRKTGSEFNGAKSRRPVLFYADAGTTAITDGYSVTHPALEIRNDSRIVITGNNGAGKTSLMRHVIGIIETSGVPFWHLPQELSGQSCQAALQNFRALPEKEQGELLSVVYRLGSEPASLLATQRLSPGEARKLLLADAMRRGAALLLLDEPTNHMDTVSALALSAAIRAFAGAAVLITHDRVFAEKTGSVFWHMERHRNTGRIRLMQLPSEQLNIIQQEK